jgi:hypothetical protein
MTAKALELTAKAAKLLKNVNKFNDIYSVTKKTKMIYLRFLHIICFN